MSEEITIKKAVLHILDNNVNIPVLSNTELEIDDAISDFLGKHITKIFSDNNLKNSRFTGESNKVGFLCAALNDNADDFLAISLDIANTLFNIMVKNVDIAPADLICCLFFSNNQPYLGILKLNYKSSFTHYVQQSEEGNNNLIIAHKTLLPSEGQKIDECILINLEDNSIKLIEKEYEINGTKDFYLSKLFLVCSSELSNNAKLKILDKVTQKINKKYFDEDFDKVAKLKKAVSERLEEGDSIQVDTLVEEVFDSNIDIQNEYLTEVRNAGLTENAIAIPEDLAVKRFTTHKIKTDTGVEINFPLNYYNNKEKMEFINNPDGTISIIIKNVGKIINR